MYTRADLLAFLESLKCIHNIKTYSFSVPPRMHLESKFFLIINIHDCSQDIWRVNNLLVVEVCNKSNFELLFPKNS